MRAQISVPFAFLAVILVLVGGMVVWMGLKQSREIQAEKESIQAADFATSLDTLIKTYEIKSPGSFQAKVFNIPGDYVCFYDKEKEVTNSDIGVWMKRFPDANVFFAPFERNTPAEVGTYRLNTTENPACVRPVDGKISIQFLSLGNRAMIVPGETIRIGDCVTISYAGDPDTKVDLVFLGGYAGFRQDVERYAGMIDGVSPLDKRKFNVYRIDAPLACRLGDIIECNEYDLKKIASNCPHDGIVVLADRSKLADFAYHIRSSSIGNIIKINTADDPYVFLHEFGHWFGNLADEYVDESYYAGFRADQFPNCASYPCEKWSLLTSACIRGCSLQSYFRSGRNSIMKDYTVSHEYGTVNEEALQERLRVYR